MSSSQSQATRGKAIEKLVQCDEHPRNMNKPTVPLDRGRPVPHPATNMTHPRNRRFNLPATSIAPQPTAVLKGCFVTVLTRWTTSLQALSLETLAKPLSHGCLTEYEYQAGE